MKKKCLQLARTISYYLLFFCLSFSLLAQASRDRAPREDLPFPISEKKRLSVRDLENKKEGGYFTGLPLINSDPNVGIGFGARVLYFENGDRKNAIYEYTPYRYRIFAQYFNTTKQAPFHWVSLDAPYIFDTQWRLRSDLIYDRNPNSLFFGIGEKSLDTLSYKDRYAPGQPTIRNATFVKYEEALFRRRLGDYSEGPNAAFAPFETDRMYNRYDIENPNFSMSGERSFLGGTVRTVIGGRFSRQIIRTFDRKIYDSFGPLLTENGLILPDVALPTPNGRTLVTKEAEAGNIVGLNGGFVNTARFGVVYDTRDFEPDPNRGLFLEATHERSMRAMGSDFEFHKNHASARVFWSPFQGSVEKLVFAGRAAFIETKGNAPFYEMRNMWGTETNQSGLGGRTTLRGFKQDRFVGPAMGFANLEIRWKFASIDTGNNHFDFQLVPFVDVGRVWNETHLVNLKGYKYSQGLGLRIPWNQATIIYIDHAWSKEDRQTFVNFMHIF